MLRHAKARASDGFPSQNRLVWRALAVIKWRRIRIEKPRGRPMKTRTLFLAAGVAAALAACATQQEAPQPAPPPAAKPAPAPAAAPAPAPAPPAPPAPPPAPQVIAAPKPEPKPEPKKPIVVNLASTELFDFNKATLTA